MLTGGSRALRPPRVSRTQAKVMSAFLVSGFMISVVISAMCCLGSLRTPRQFEEPKES